MRTEVRHTESWHVTVSREDGDTWPDRMPVSPLTTRQMRPEQVSFRLVAGRAEPDTIQVYGSDPGAHPHVSRYHAERMPEWLATVIGDARQENGLTPAGIADDAPGPVLTEEGGDFITEWFCEPPARNVPFRVVRDEWLDRDPKPVRRVYRWQQDPC